MDNVGMRRYYIDDLEMEAHVYINLENYVLNGRYFTKLLCSEKEVENMRKDELFRFFADNPRVNLAHKVLKDMTSYWALSVINNSLVKDTKVKIYRWINDEEFEEVDEDAKDFKWGDIVSISINKAVYSIKDILVEESPLGAENTYCITGDTHGDLDFRIFYEARKAGYSNIFVCGDFGYIWDGSLKENKRLDYLSSIGLNIYWVDGNHENFDLLNNYPIVDFNGGKSHKIRDNIYHLIRGEIYTFGDKKILAFGGANSTDKYLRKEGTSWWPQEVPSEDEKEHARNKLREHDYIVDYIITHTGHTEVLRDMRGNIRIDDVSDFLSEIYHTSKFKHWYFGHMHENYHYKEGNTTCINKSILKIDI